MRESNEEAVCPLELPQNAASFAEAFNLGAQARAMAQSGIQSLACNSGVIDKVGHLAMIYGIASGWAAIWVWTRIGAYKNLWR